MKYQIHSEIKKQITKRIEKFNDDFDYPINPIKLVIDVRNALEENDIVISDVGTHKLWIAKTYNTYIPNTCLITNGSIGIHLLLVYQYLKYEI